MVEAQDAGDRLGAQAHLGVEALDQALTAAGKIVNRRGTLTPYRRAILTPRSSELPAAQARSCERSEQRRG
jgi:hypothetical protein